MQTIPARVTYGEFDDRTITYTASTRAIVTYFTTVVPNMMGATLTQTNASLRYRYLIGVSGSTLNIYNGSPDATYVSYLRNDDTVPTVSVYRLALIGAPTIATELPATSAATYRLAVAEIGTLAAGQQTLAVDWAARRISGTVPVILTGSTAAISVDFQGSFDPGTGRFIGTATTADGAHAGAFRGRFYGPSGGEIGLIFDLIDRNGVDRAGIILGRAA